MNPIRLSHIQRAWDVKDPDLPELVIACAMQPDPKPEKAVRKGAPDFQSFLREIRSPAFRKKSKEEQAHYRREQMRMLEAPDAEIPLPDRLKLHEILMTLWADNGPYARNCLLRIIADIRLCYGPWRALKQIAKEAGERQDTEILGALAARFDAACAGAHHEVSVHTLGYMCRRIWRFLRRTGENLPPVYADAACEMLMHYTEDCNWKQTWIVNHILYHGTKKYGRKQFHLHSSDISDSSDALRHRAFPELWTRSPRPLFSLLERARSEYVRRFAVKVLKKDFRSRLRETEAVWVVRLCAAGSRTADEFAVWILQNAPRFEQAAFRELGLHEAVLRLFDSASDKACRYAADYARTHARDLPVDELIRLVNNKSESVRKLAEDLLQARDPRKEIGLDAWGRLLETPQGFELAAAVLKKHFGPKELTPEWFADRLLSESSFTFAEEMLPSVHSLKKLGAEYFCRIIERIDPDAGIWFGSDVADFALDKLEGFDVNSLDGDFLALLLLHPLCSDRICFWFEEGKLKTENLDISFLKALASPSDWKNDPRISRLMQGEKSWGRQLEFNEELAESVLSWLGDVRRFSAQDLGFDWLMGLVQKSDPPYQTFATDVMIRSFNPADFAQDSEIKAEEKPSEEAGEREADFQGASFLFTGKLATMTRKEAQQKVTTAKGKNATAVNGKLDYLVIGDEGSPLYGAGRKGSKQVKAEKLMAGGAGIRIISETAFLQMLSGKKQEVSEDAVAAGCERLWEMLTAPGSADEPLRQFALSYFRRHHPDICLEETDRPVDPGAEIPSSFLSFDRVESLFGDERRPLREFALELAKWEFAAWSPPPDALIRLCGLPHAEVRNFVARALLAEDMPEHRRYRLNPENLPPSAVYDLCESAEAGSRNLGMELILRYPVFQLPESLFQLTESPDRRVRGFVIRSLWNLYRDRGLTAGWKPQMIQGITMGKKARKKAVEKAADMGEGVKTRPEQVPAEFRQMKDLFRRVLFEIPPGRPEKSAGQEEGDTPFRLKHLPARKAKLSLIETMRDMAVEDGNFAQLIRPLLEEFMTSEGKSEQAACLVAVTRIRHAHQQTGNTA